MLRFYTSTMAAGKTTQLIATYDIYKRKNLNPIILKPATDTREGTFHGWGTTKSRITSKEVPAYYYQNIKEIDNLNFNSILVDEAQFMSPQDVKYLAKVTDDKDITTLAYGLKTDVNGNLFPGAAALIALADEILEIENLCQAENCTNKAVVHARYINGVRDNSGQSVAIEQGNVTYKALCRKHWREGQKE